MVLGNVTPCTFVVRTCVRNYTPSLKTVICRKKKMKEETSVLYTEWASPVDFIGTVLNEANCWSFSYCQTLYVLTSVNACSAPFIMIFLLLSHVCKHTQRHVIVLRSVSLDTCRFLLSIFKYCPWAPFSSIVSYLILGYLLDINLKFFGALACYAITWTMNGSRASLKRGLPAN